MFSLKGKVAIITGSDRGIGEGIATVFAKAGASIVVCSPSKERCEEEVAKLKKLGAKAIAIACDVSKEEDVQKLVAQTVKEFGKLDIMVNNAGVLLSKPLDEVEQKDLNWQLGINLNGVLLGTKHAAKEMKKQKNGGCIINTASIAALVGYSMLSTYCASKGGIAAFTRAASAELAPYKIRVNAICPGLIESEMTKPMLADPKSREEFLKAIPLRIVGQPEDIGHGALYLASDEARYVSGISLVIDGGETATT